MEMRLIGGLLIAMLVPSLSFAGETLRLKSIGDVRSNDKIVVQFSAPTGSVNQEAGLYLVQWKNQVREEEKAELGNLGFTLLSYVPDDAFLVSGNSAQAKAAEGLSFIRTVIPYRSGFKVDPALQKLGVFTLNARELVSVNTKAETTEADLNPYFTSVKKVGDGLFVGETTRRNVWNLANRTDVLWIEQYLPVKAMDLSWKEMVADEDFSDQPTQPNYTGYESGTRLMNVDAAYNAGIHGEGMLTAFGDTGLDKGDLNDLIPDFQGQVAVARAMGLGGSSWGDPQNHGTHVAGSIAGNGRSSDGIIRGGAYGAKLVVQGLWSDILNNIAIPQIPKLFKQAREDGARIHSNSWGAPNSEGRYDSFTVAADKFMFENMDFLAVFAAGNDGADLDQDGVIDEGTVSSPGSAKNVLTVGASKNYLLEGGIQRKMADLRDGKKKWGVEPLASSMLSEDAHGMAAFSSRGPTADGRLKPEVVAPGTNIVSARNTNPKADPSQSWGVFNDHYLYMGGTSMATPLVSGAVTLVRQYLVKALGTEHVSAALIKATVANTATDLFPGQFGIRSKGQEQPTPRPNNHEGWGLVNLAPLFENSHVHLVDNWTGVKTGEEKSFDIDVARKGDVSITMAYTDAPGTAAATKALVNDLDLTVVTPSGETLYPFGRSAKDSVNNMEQIDLKGAAPGRYHVVVTGANVPSGKKGAQPYALVVSGSSIE